MTQPPNPVPPASPDPVASDPVASDPVAPDSPDPVSSQPAPPWAAYGQPQYSAPPSGQPQYSAPQYDPQQYYQQFSQPQYYQQYGQPQHGHPDHPQPLFVAVPYGPPQYAPPQYSPPPKQNFWKSTAGILTAVGVSALVLVLCAGVTVVGVLAGTSDDSGSGSGASDGRLDAKVIGCEFTGSGSFITATVDYTVANRTDRALPAAVTFVYQDAGGTQVDTDTAYLQSVAAGDTVTAVETTLMRTPIRDGRCLITAVR